MSYSALPPGPPPGPPGPPPGPGVTPPFAAPPVEGRSTRLWLGLGGAALAALLCCGGGLAAGIGLVVTGTQAVNDRAQATVRNYLDDVRTGRYTDAYDALCPTLQRRETARQFADRVDDEPKISGYDLRDVDLATGQVILPVDVRYTGGTNGTLRFELEQDQGTGDFEVCGIAG
jgi:hypothetical protein